MAIRPKYIKDIRLKKHPKSMPSKSLTKKDLIMIKSNLLKIKSISILPLIIPISSNATMFMTPII